MNKGVGIGIGAAVLAVVAGGGWIYAGSVATAHAEQALEDVRAQLPPGATLTVDGLSASPLGSVSVDGFTMTLADGATLRGGAASASGDADRVDAVDMADLALSEDDLTVTAETLSVRGLSHPDFERLTRTLRGEAGGYSDPVEALRALSVESVDIGDLSAAEDGDTLSLGGLSISDVADGTVGRFGLTDGAFAKRDNAASLGRFSVEGVEVADAVAAALRGADEEDIMAVTRYGAFEVADVSAVEDGVEIFRLGRFALEDPVHVGDVVMAGTFILDDLAIDQRQNMGSAQLARLADVLGPAAEEPFAISGRAVSTYDDGAFALETMRFDADGLGFIEMSAAGTGYELDPAAVTDVPADAQREALINAAMGAVATDFRLTVSHTGWVHEAIRQDAGGPRAAEQQAAMLGMVAAMGAAAVVGREDAGALAEGIGAFLTEKTELDVSLDNPRGLSMREVMASGGRGGALDLTVETR
ncbi:hypothetical protein C882_0134 [Caenispirillum salinarum AK4]|uniref:DUF945 domain-containing protein n=1 Tax=Caenispirillum salinarum AK4 TaxID=1238182 RepID=K9HI16_9PROT|nr:hypothetical protein [Caenispirillum salinarum]EKV30053.1 hypothetical protein C882_0134 [Caenispirillum salinarum AK4]